MSERLLHARPSASASWPRRLGFVIFPGFQLLDLTGPVAVFDAAARLGMPEVQHGALAYSSLVLAATAGPVKSSAGLEVTATSSYRGWAEELDTLVVVGGEGSRRAAEDAALIAWLRAMAPKLRRLGSICTGAFVLAGAGLLDGRRATTHWASCSTLQQRYPAIEVDADAIYVRDGKLFTSAGVTAGMDLALALVEEDCGRALALAVARWLVMFVKRPGGQSQFSAQLAAQAAAAPAIGRLQEWALAHLADDLSVPALAARAAMSGRNFARVFLRETGSTPGDFVESARLEAARRQLEESDHALERVAREAGFGNADRLRRTFLRRLGLTPLDYRRRFRFTPPPVPRRTAQQEGATR